MCRRPRIEARLALLATALVASACAAELPANGGHLTDPRHRLSDSARSGIDERLGRITIETRVYMAGWISDASEDDADALGKAAYKSWNVGNGWYSGLFFVFPAVGRVHVIQDEGRPDLSPAELATLTAADEPGENLAKRIGRLADIARGLLVPRPRVPDINGHLTDPGQRLTQLEKRAVEDRLTKLAADTHIDIAGWLTEVTEERVVSYGDEAYRHWKIGLAWDNGLFFAFPVSGRVRLIQDPAGPELSPAEADALVAVDDPKQSEAKRIERLTDAVRAVLVPRTRHKPRPPGLARPQQGHVYLLATAAVALAGIVLSFRRRKSSSTWLLANPSAEQDSVPVDQQRQGGRGAGRRRNRRRGRQRRRGH